jgi:hypothetical protein
MDLTAILQLLPALASTNIALLAEAWAAIVRVPLVLRILLGLQLFWTLYLAWTAMEHRFKTMSRIEIAFCLLPVLTFGAMDVAANYTLGWLLLKRWPQDVTLTKTLGRVFQEGTGWRLVAALWLASKLDRYDRDGWHVAPPEETAAARARAAAE